MVWISGDQESAWTCCSLFHMNTDLTIAVTCGHPVAKQMWTNNASILNECKLEGHTTKHSESILSIVRATKVLVSDYIAGRLNAAAERQRTETDKEIVQHADLRHDQHRADDRVREFVTLSMQVHNSESEHEADEAGETSHKDNLVIAVLGPPGTGKTTLTHRIVQWAQ